MAKTKEKQKTEPKYKSVNLPTPIHGELYEHCDRHGLKLQPFFTRAIRREIDRSEKIMEAIAADED